MEVPFQISFPILTDDYGCPIPCKQTSYKVSVRNVQKNKADIYELEDTPLDQLVQAFYFIYGFDTLNTEQRIETLDYDFGNLVVAAGGNLGLFLGLSCLSILMPVVDFMENAAGKLKTTTSGKKK